MAAPLNILHLEDDSDDALFVRRLLQRAGIECSIEVVHTRRDFVSALERGKVDLILSDHSLPGFDSMAALEIASSSRPEIPFVIVSGALGEEHAVRALRNGATDYILKGNPARLVPAVQRAMKDVEEARERRRLERQFIEAQKMEVMGRLVSSVAHDFNNILSVILGYCESVGQSLGEGHALRSDIEEARHASERGAALVRQLLGFSSRQEAHAVVLDLNETVRAYNNMLQRLIGENIRMTVNLAEDIGRVRADSGHIGQVMMNMVVNARDAMPGGGDLVITTESRTVRDPFDTLLSTVPPGRYVVLSIADDGVGIAPEVMEHVFESFYTTKAKGIGTGLGLATCLAIVRQCDGHIHVRSEVNRGSTFEIFLPRVDHSAAAPIPAAPASSVPTGTETILLVEDDPALSRLASRTLSRLGYRVLLANDGHEGLRIATEAHDPPISLVVTDVVMPQMGGQAMAEKLRKVQPGLRVLFTSGYTGDVLMRNGALESGAAVLHKPYTPSILARHVRRIIDR